MSGRHQKLVEKHESSTKAVDSETVERLALAVAKPGSDALLINEDNLYAGRMAISEAVLSARCFAVELRRDMIGLDIDKPNAVRWMNFLIEDLKNRKIPIVIVSSGTPGHFHLFTPVRDAKLRTEIESAAHLFGCDVRTGQRIRPPLSPHRLGLCVGLITPATPAQALEALTPVENCDPPQSRRKRSGPSGRLIKMLREGNHDRRYPGRSEMIQAIAIAAVNADLSESWLLKALLDPKNHGGEKIQQLARKKGEHEAHRYVAMVYRNARKFVADFPPFRGRPDALAKIEEIERGIAIDVERWKGRAGATDLVILCAHLQIMRRCGRLEHGASVRELAHLTGISTSTVSAAHSRLQPEYLRCTAQVKDGTSARYIVRLPKPPSRTVLSIKGALGDCSVEGSLCGADVFRWKGGLGKAPWRVWQVLDGRTIVELSILLGLKQHSVAKHLWKLRTHDLAASCPEGRWRRLNNLDAAAEKLRVAGEGERQRDRYASERENYIRRRSNR